MYVLHLDLAGAIRFHMPYTFTENAAAIRWNSPGSQYYPSTVVEPSVETDRTYAADVENYQPIIISSSYLNYLEYIFCGFARVNDRDAVQRSRPAGADPQLLIRTQAYLKARAANCEPSSAQREAWDRFFKIHDPFVHRSVAAWHLQPWDAEECVQMTWVEIVRKLPDLRFDPRLGTFRGWLATLIRRQVCHFLAGEKRRRLSVLTIKEYVVPGDESDEPAELAMRRESRLLVQRMIQDLQREVSEMSYQVMYLHCVKGLSHSETAARLGLTQQSVRYRYHRMMQKIEQFALRSSCVSEGVDRGFAISCFL
jgi:RNA polymerase sigma factor (sigma-70 family)